MITGDERYKVRKAIADAALSRHVGNRFRAECYIGREMTDGEFEEYVAYVNQLEVMVADKHDGATYNKNWSR